MCLGMAGGYIEPKEEKKTSLLKQKTNNDKINEMSVEEKAELFLRTCCVYCAYRRKRKDCQLKRCVRGITEWLESEAEE